MIGGVFQLSVSAATLPVPGEVCCGSALAAAATPRSARPAGVLLDGQPVR
jgi:hypothetical protein